MARSRGKRCYFCGNKASGREHIPPKQLFRGIACDSITVPSCDVHNTSKSFDDQVIVDSFLKVKEWQQQNASISVTATQALKTRQSSFVRTKKRISLAKFIDHPNLSRIPYLEPGTNIGKWMRQIAAGLIYDGIGYFDGSVDWLKAEVSCPWYFQVPKTPPLSLDEGKQLLEGRIEAADAIDQSFQWFDGWSAYPRPYPTDVFTFRVGFDTKGFVRIRLRFFNTGRWYVVAKVSRRARQALREKLAGGKK